MWVALVRCVIALEFLDGFLNASDFWQLNGTWVKSVCMLLCFSFFFFRMHSLYQVESFIAHPCMCVCYFINYLSIIFVTHTLSYRFIPGIDKLDPGTLFIRDQSLFTVVLPYPDSWRPHLLAGTSSESKVIPVFMDLSCLGQAWTDRPSWSTCLIISLLEIHSSKICEDLLIH